MLFLLIGTPISIGLRLFKEAAKMSLQLSKENAFYWFSIYYRLVTPVINPVLLTYAY